MISHHQTLMTRASLALDDLGYMATWVDDRTIEFEFKGGRIFYKPHCQRASGRTIKDCRSFKQLVKQIKK